MLRVNALRRLIAGRSRTRRAFIGSTKLIAAVAAHGCCGEDLAIKAKPVGSPLTHRRCIHRKKTRNNAISNRLRQAGPPARSTIRVLAILNCESHCRVRLLCLGQARIGRREFFWRTAGANPAEKQHTQKRRASLMLRRKFIRVTSDPRRLGRYQAGKSIMAT